MTDEQIIADQGRRILALRAELRAEVARQRERAWDEGYTSGHSNAMRYMSDEPNAPRTPNPYRSEGDRD